MIKECLMTGLVAFTMSAFAASLEAPPTISNTAQPAAAYQAPQKQARKADVDNRLEPSEADLMKAREARAKRSHAQEEPYVSNRGTKIQAIKDQNNHLTRIEVTPHETEFSYTMKNKSDRPIQNGAGGNPRSTLGTPEFIHFTW